MTHAQTRFLACIHDLPTVMLNTVRADEAAKALHEAIDRELNDRRAR